MIPFRRGSMQVGTEIFLKKNMSDTLWVTSLVGEKENRYTERDKGG